MKYLLAVLLLACIGCSNRHASGCYEEGCWSAEGIQTAGEIVHSEFVDISQDNLKCSYGTDPREVPCYTDVSEFDCYYFGVARICNSHRPNGVHIERHDPDVMIEDSELDCHIIGYNDDMTPIKADEECE